MKPSRFLHSLSHLWMARGRRLKSEQQVIDAAHSDATTNPASPNPGTEPNSTQYDIIISASKHVARYRRHIDVHGDGWACEVQEVAPTRTDMDFDEKVRNVEHHLHTLVDEAAQKFAECKERVTEARDYYVFFKRTNQLARPARYPEHRALAFSLPAALVLAETVANVRLFAGVDAMGITGGTLMALSVSLSNVAPSLCVGAFILRYFFHVRKAFAIWARLATFMYVIGIVGLNAYFAQYRESLAANADGVEPAVLFILGLVAATLALLDGYAGLDDPYAGFGKADRLDRQAVASTRAVGTSFRRRSSDLVNSGLADIDAKESGFEESVRQTNPLIDEAASCFRNCQDQTRQVTARCEHLLMVYEERFAALRQSSLSPPTSCLAKLDADLGVDADNMLAHKESLKRAAAQVHAQASSAKARLRELHERQARIIDELEKEALGAVADRPDYTPELYRGGRK